MSRRRFVIPDIHGCARTFAALLHDVLRLKSTDILYLLGDYTDRGPRSREVVDAIMHLQQTGYLLYPLRGNHDDMLLRACGNLDYLRVWLLNGGRTTLESFGVDDPCEIPLLYRRFFSRLPYYLELEDCILVHAGLNYHAENPFSDTDAMLWSRPSDGEADCIAGKAVISGHTPVTRETIKRCLHTGRILLDNGCVYSTKPELGTLAALELDSRTLYFQKYID
jgi:serine/threonine protein phosphatase 1